MIANSLLRAMIDAFPAFGTGHRGLSLLDIPGIYGKGRTGLCTDLTFCAFILVNLYMEYIDFVGQGKKCSHGAEGGTLDAFFGKNRKNDDQSDK